MINGVNQPTINQSKNSTIKNTFFTIKKFNQVILLLIILISLFYLYGMNSISINGFKLKELKDQKNKLAIENQDFELNIMLLSSYNNINERVKDLKMVAVGRIDYITSGIEVMAKK